MARVAPSVAVFLSLLFLLTLSRARDLQTPFPEPKPESEPATRSEPKPQTHDTVSFTLDSIDPVPLKLLRFRPINRHFQPGRPLPTQLPLSLRTGHRRCRHGHPREIPYGNDAIVLSDGATRRIHPRWVRLRGAAEPRLPAAAERQDFDREHHRHGEHPHHHHHRRGEDSWFAKKIRKFMNLF